MNDSPVRLARQATREQLANPINGLNEFIFQTAASFGVPAWEFNFAPDSRNVFEGNVSFDDVSKSGNPGRNLLTLFGLRSVSFGPDERVFSASFSGTVDLQANMYVGVMRQKPSDFEVIADVAEAAMLGAMNTFGNQEVLNTGTGEYGKVYAMDPTTERMPVGFDGENWVVQVQFNFSFGVIIT